MKLLSRLKLYCITRVFFGALLLWFAACTWGTYVIHFATLSDSNPQNAPSLNKPIALPFLVDSLYPFRHVPAGKTPIYVFNVAIYGHDYQRANFHIVPDDCVTAIKVNGISVDLKNIDHSKRCDIKNGFLIDLNKAVNPGYNLLEITVSDIQGGRYGLTMTPVLFSEAIDTTILVFLLLGCVWSYVLLRACFNYPIVLTSLFSLFIGLFVFYHTGISDRAPDWWGHIEYLNYMGEHWNIPVPNAGWQFYQPPLYYAVGAVFGSIGSFFHADFLQAARYFSIPCLLVFELFGLLIIRTTICTPAIRYLCSAAFLFWPLLMALMGRTSNEALLYPLWAASYYYLLRWHHRYRPYDLAIAIGLCAVMMLVKISALVPLGTIGSVMLYEVVTRRMNWRDYIRPAIGVALALVILSVGYNVGRTLYYRSHGMPQLGMIIGNLNADPILSHIHSSNDFYKFSTLNINILLHSPFWSFLDDFTGRQFFWNSYFKTSLFGDFLWPNPDLAIVLNVCLVVLAVFAIAAPIRNGSFNNRAFFIICIVMALMAQIVNRLIIETVITEDARMTFPVIIAFITFLGLLIEHLFQLRRFTLAIAGSILLAGFVCMNVYLMLLMVFAPYA